MAVVEGPISEDIIRGYKGIFVFYQRKDMNPRYWCVRSWPQHYKTPMDERSVFCRQVKRGCHNLCKWLPPEMRDYYDENAKGSGFTWIDWFLSKCMKEYYKTEELPYYLIEFAYEQLSPTIKITYKLNEYAPHRITKHRLSGTYQKRFHATKEGLAKCPIPPDPPPDDDEDPPPPVWKVLAESPNYDGGILRINCDAYHVFVSGYGHTGGTYPTYIRKYTKGTLSFVCASDVVGFQVWGMTTDSYHVFVGGNGAYIKKYNKSNLSFTGIQAVVGGIIQAIKHDNLYIYTGGGTNKIEKYKKEDLSKVAESPIQNNIWALTMDNTHIYAGDSAGYIKKYNKSDLSYTGISCYQGAGITELTNDEEYIYSVGQVNHPRKYKKSDLSLVAEGPYETGVNAIAVSSQYCYTGGTWGNTKKFNISDLTYTGESQSYGAQIYDMITDGYTLFVGGQHQVGIVVKYGMDSTFTKTLTMSVKMGDWLRISPVPDGPSIIAPLIQIK